MDDSNLIFVVSQPRSGSTLLQRILSNNSEVATASEPWILLPLLSLGKSELNQAVYNYDVAGVAINDFISYLGRDRYENCLKEFVYSLYGGLSGCENKYVLDKTPRYYEILDELQELFPNSKIIILKRNPIAVLSSVLKTFKGPINRNYRDLVYAPKKLQQFLQKHKANPNVCEILYEDLVTKPDTTVRELYSWLNIQYTDDVLDYSCNSLNGRMGDPKIDEHSTPHALSVSNWEKGNDDEISLYRGYAQYLGTDFLLEYGDYKPLNGEVGMRFIDEVMKNTITEQEYVWLSTWVRWNATVLKGKQVAIYGGGEHTQQLVDLLGGFISICEVVHILDRQPSKKFIGGIPVISSSTASFENYDYIIISSKDFEEEIYYELTLATDASKILGFYKYK